LQQKSWNVLEWDRPNCANLSLLPGGMICRRWDFLAAQFTLVDRRHLACNQMRIPSAQTSMEAGGTESKLNIPLKCMVAAYTPHMIPPEAIRLPRRSSVEIATRGPSSLRFLVGLATGA